jgi:hypothetical protein
LTRDIKRYTYRHDVEAIDVGLRLEDVMKCQLESEAVYFRERASKCRFNLQKNGATPDEIQFLIGQQRRVELNAFASGDLVSWIEEKLESHGVKKVLPDLDVLKSAYRESYVREYIRNAIPALREEARRLLETDGRAPEDLRERAAEWMAGSKAEPWDAAIGNLAKRAVRGIG